MKLKIKAQATSLHNEFTKNDPGNSKTTYNLSMPLLASAIIHDDELYNTIDADMVKRINTVEPLSMRVWMLGRLLVAAQLMGNNKHVDLYKKMCEELLSDKNTPKDVMTGWATAYLASLNDKTYQQQASNLIYYLNAATKAYENDQSTDNLTNLLWTITMNAYAAAKTGHHEDYHQFLAAFIDATKKERISDAIAEMPISDYKAWLLSLNVSAAKLTGDETHLALFQELLDSTLADDKIGKADRMLANAQSLLDTARTVYQKTSAEPKQPIDEAVTSSLK